VLIAIPSDAPGGLAAAISDHFGHCAAFTLVEIADGEVGEVRIIDNGEHARGGCLAPVGVLKELAVEALVVGTMGKRPLAGFQEAGIAVHSREGAGTVAEAVRWFVEGKCPVVGESQGCGGGHCGGHDHAEVAAPRAPIEGPADVRDGRLATLGYELRDDAGALLDASATSGEMRYVQGSGAFPGIERAIAGHLPGDRITVALTPTEGFGEREDDRIFTVARDRLPPEVTLGDVVAAHDSQGHPIRLIVRAIDDETAQLDANHPLAGKHLVFDLTVVRVESATPEEIAHGHAH